MKSARTKEEAPRERILATARELFRRHGVRGVGVDTIASEAGTNKMTLYRHFGSKDELIVSCLESFASEVCSVWQELAAAHPGDPLKQIEVWIDRVADYLDSNGRGCDISNAAVELAADHHPAREVIERFKRDERDRLAALCRAAGLQDPDLLADTLTLLVEGARVRQQTVGAESGLRFRAAATATLRAFHGR